MATTSEPKQMLPSEVVQARLNAPSVGLSMSATSHQLATIPAVVTCPMFFSTWLVQYSEKTQNTTAKVCAPDELLL